ARLLNPRAPLHGLCIWLIYCVSLVLLGLFGHSPLTPLSPALSPPLCSIGYVYCCVYDTFGLTPSLSLSLSLSLPSNSHSASLSLSLSSTLSLSPLFISSLSLSLSPSLFFSLSRSHHPTPLPLYISLV